MNIGNALAWSEVSFLGELKDSLLWVNCYIIQAHRTLTVIISSIRI